MARRDRNAALAGLAALGALMYARSRKKEGETEKEEVKPIRTTTTAPKEEFIQGAVMPGDEVKSTLAPAKPAPAKPATSAAPVTPAAPAAGAGRSAGIGGPTAAQMAQAAMGAGGGRGGVGGPRIGEREAYAAAQRPTVADIRKADVAAEQKSLAERQKRLATPGADAIEQDIDVLSPFPGLGRAKKAVQTSTALANKSPGFSNLTFLGKGPQKDVTPPRQIGTSERGLLEGPKSADRVGVKPPPKELPPASATAQDRMREMKMGRYRDDFDMPLKKGGKAKVKKMASGGMAKSSISKRADGIAKRGKTRGKMY